MAHKLLMADKFVQHSVYLVSFPVWTILFLRVFLRGYLITEGEVEAHP